MPKYDPVEAAKRARDGGVPQTAAEQGPAPAPIPPPIVVAAKVSFKPPPPVPTEPPDTGPKVDPDTLGNVLPVKSRAYRVLNTKTIGTSSGMTQLRAGVIIEHIDYGDALIEGMVSHGVKLEPIVDQE